jgi:hypothetical protein
MCKPPSHSYVDGFGVAGGRPRLLLKLRVIAAKQNFLPANRDKSEIMRSEDRAALQPAQYGPFCERGERALHLPDSKVDRYWGERQ